MDYPTLYDVDNVNADVLLSMQWSDGSRIDYMKNGTVFAWLVEGDWFELMGYIYRTVEDYNQYNWFYRGDIDMDTHEKHGSGIVYYDDGSVYTGEFSDNEAHGEGTYTCSLDGSVFIGWSEYGQRVYGIQTMRKYETRARVVDGVNVYTDEHLSSQPKCASSIDLSVTLPLNQCSKVYNKVFVDYEYEGGFMAGKYHGKGTLTRSDGYVLQGYFLEGGLYGSDSTISDPANGFFYEGSVFHNKPFGQGRAQWEDGRTFVGKYLSCDRAEGTMTWLNGDVYVGSFEFDCLDGHGVMTCADGRVYTGEFELDEPEGRGKMSWPTGDSYEGAFVNGKIDMNTVGIFTFGNATDKSSCSGAGACSGASAGGSISGTPGGFMSQFVNLEDYVVSMSRCTAL